MKKEAENFFRPEFLNRLDDIITFNGLTRENISVIVDLAIKKLNARIAHRDIDISITQSMKDHIIDKGYSPKYGARPINRAISSIIEDYMADRLLRKEFNDGMSIEFDWSEQDGITHTIISNRNDSSSSSSSTTSLIDQDSSFRNIFMSDPLQEQQGMFQAFDFADIQKSIKNIQKKK